MRKPHSPFLASIYEQMLMLRYAMATVEAYLHWIKAFIRFSRMKHPVELGEAEVQQFLSYLVTERHVAVKTQAQALNALVLVSHCLVTASAARDEIYAQPAPSQTANCFDAK